jgi:GNAT superfamily N-acetyltransferase
MKTYYLQMNSPDDLVKTAPREGLCLRVVDPPDGAINERFYREVGQAWNWAACAEWTIPRWNEYLASNPVSTVVLVLDNEDIGYGELINRDGDVEILSFGLLENFLGRGLGGAALEMVVRYAWTLGAVDHVWLHTCEQDHPNALPNYQRRGFILYETREGPVPETRPGT